MIEIFEYIIYLLICGVLFLLSDRLYYKIKNGTIIYYLINIIQIILFAIMVICLYYSFKEALKIIIEI